MSTTSIFVAQTLLSLPTAMRFFLGTIALFGLASASGVQHVSPLPASVTGQVVDGAHQPLAGVSVWVMGTNMGASTNSEGQFQFADVNSTSFTLRFDLAGYRLTDVVVSDTTRRPLIITLISTRPLPHSRKGKP